MDTQFRVWKLSEKRWIAGAEPKFGVYTPYNWLCNTHNEGDLVWQQFTGVLDKDNNKIFQGDIVEFEHSDYTDIYKDVGEVYFESGIFYFHRKYEFATNDVKSLKVLGNIFETPELLNQ